jgi:hypothetical protein
MTPGLQATRPGPALRHLVLPVLAVLASGAAMVMLARLADDTTLD